MKLDRIELAPVIGTMVRGLDLSRDMSEPLMRQLIDLLFERGMVVIPGQSLSSAEYVRFARYFGRPLDFYIPEHRDAEHPEIIPIHNDPATPLLNRDGAVQWHSDSSYETVPATVTMLFGKETPDEGGVTDFARTSTAYDSLPDDTKRRIDGLVARHELGRAPCIDGEVPLDPRQLQRATDNPDHPLVMSHPVTGRKAIFTSRTAYAIRGMDDTEATTLIRSLREHIVRPEHCVSYKVCTGDIVMWDNFSVVHCATPAIYSNEDGKRRLLHRISTKGLPPCFADAA